MKICFIATGGTIACFESEHGYMPGMGAQQMLEAVPEIRSMCQVEMLQLMQLDSSNLIPAHWQKIARTVLEHYEEYDGFVISHGTDTMAYTAAALYYMLKNIKKPVILTGSQLPLTVEGTDATQNLLTAFHGAVSGRGGVYLAFAGHILPGNAAKKMYSKNFHAFYSINRPEAAVLEGDRLVWLEEESSSGEFLPNLELEDRVMVLKLLPGTNPQLLRALADLGYKGIILETFGAGGVPTEESPLSMLPAIDYAIKKGVVLVCTTQCIYDGVHLETYEVGVRAMEHGVLSGGSQTVEALAVKLMLALGRAEDIDEVKKLMLEE